MANSNRVVILSSRAALHHCQRGRTSVDSPTLVIESVYGLLTQKTQTTMSQNAASVLFQQHK